MKEITVSLTDRELTHIRVALLLRMSNLKKALDKNAESGDPIDPSVSNEVQENYTAIQELMNGKLWQARRAMDTNNEQNL